MSPIFNSLNYPKCSTAKIGASVLFSGFGKLVRLFSFLMVFAAPVAAAPNDCRPEGMSDAEAARIIAIATEQGKAFRAAIDKMRADGVRYETDTTYEDLMADPERVLALAKERYESHRIIGITTKSRLEQGDDLNEVLMGTLNVRVQKKTTNFFTAKMRSHLQNLIVLIGAEPTSSPHRFMINPDKFIFALSHFAKNAELNKLRGTIKSGKHFLSASYRFTEDWSLFKKDALFEIGITLTTSIERDDIVLESILFRGVDVLKRGWPLSFRKNDECLETFGVSEE